MLSIDNRVPVVLENNSTYVGIRMFSGFLWLRRMD